MKFRRVINYLLLICLAISLYSCQPKWTPEDLFGEWKTVSWTINETNQEIDQIMDFSFYDDKTYKVDYGTMFEEGKFWTETDYLVTVENGKHEKKVKILNITQDSFIFQMNRSGRLEDVVLIKE